MLTRESGFYYIRFNKPGPLRIGELVRVKKMTKNRIVLEKQYDGSTPEDIANGTLRINHELFSIELKQKED